MTGSSWARNLRILNIVATRIDAQSAPGDVRRAHDEAVANSSLAEVVGGLVGMAEMLDNSQGAANEMAHLVVKIADAVVKVAERPAQATGMTGIEYLRALCIAGAAQELESAITGPVALMPNSVSVSFGADAAKLMAGLSALGEGIKETGARIKETFGVAAQSVEGDVAKMDEALSTLNRTIEAKVTVGGDATARLDHLKAKLDEFAHAVATAKTKVDDTESEQKLLKMEAALDRLGAKTSKPTITVGGIAESEAKLLAIQAELKKLSDEKISPKVDVSTSGSGGGDMKKVASDASAAADSAGKLGSAAASSSDGMSKMMMAGIALSPALVTLTNAAGGLAAALPAIGAGAASGLAALKIGFDGISEAVSALMQPTAATSQSMDALKTAQNSAAQSAASAAQAITAAQQALASAVSTASYDQQSAVESLAKAEQAAANARVSAAQSIVSAQQGLASAEQALGNAVQSEANARVSAALSVTSAQQGLASSEQALGNAQYSEEQAQKSLTQARVDAKDALTNLNDQVKDGALSQRQASIDVIDAQKALATAPGGANYSQLQLNVEKALQAQKDLADHQDQLKAKTAQANAQGVEGSNLVQGALHGVDAAIQAVGNAQQAQANAATALARAQVTGAQQVAAAIQAVGNAQQAVGNAETALQRAQVTGAQQVQAADQAVGDTQRSNARQALNDAQAIEKAHTAVATAIRNQGFQAEQSALAVKNAMLAATGQTGALQQAMANLTPAGLTFVTFLKGSLIPQFQELKAKVQDALLPGIEAGLKAMQPAIKVFGESIVTAGKGIGDWFTQFGKLIGQGPGLANFTKIIQLGGKFMADLGQAILPVISGVLAIGAKAGPVLDMIIKAISGVAAKFSAWASGPGGQQFMDNAVKALSALGPALGHLADLASALLTAFAPLGNTIVTLVGHLADKLTPVVQKLSPFLDGLANCSVTSLPPRSTSSDRSFNTSPSS